MVELQEKPLPSRGSMPASERPPKPGPIACSGGCGLMIEPEFYEAVEFNGHVLKGLAAGWDYPVRTCDPCLDRIYQANMRQYDAQDAVAQKANLIALLGGIKPVEDFTFDHYVPKTDSQRDALSVFRDFQPGEQNLYAWGKTGGGKTHLASALAASAFRARMTVCFFKPGRFLRSLRMKEPDEHEKLLRRYANVDVFVLDDLGIGKATEFALEAFYELVDMRDMNRKNGLVVTSNLSLDQLAVKLGDDRLPSRLAGLCKPTLHIEGPDHRATRRER